MRDDVRDFHCFSRETSNVNDEFRSAVTLGLKAVLLKDEASAKCKLGNVPFARKRCLTEYLLDLLGNARNGDPDAAWPHLLPAPPLYDSPFE